MRHGVKINDFTITSDLDCNSLEYKTPSVFVINFDYIAFVLEIRRPHDTKVVETEVIFNSLGKFTIGSYPENAHTGIISKELMSDSLKEKLKLALGKWSVVLQKLYESSVKIIKFPELCYYCP